MFNLLKVLQKREVNGTNELQSWVDKKSADNIRKDKPLKKKIIVKSNIWVLGRCGDLVATVDRKNQLSLFDVSISKKLWSLHIDNLDNYALSYRGLIVADTGLVLYIAQEKGWVSNYHPHIQILSEGKKTGELFLNEHFILSSLKIINNRIFGISQSSTTIRELHEWDLSGDLIRSLSMDNLKQSYGLKIAASNDYYIVSAGYIDCFKKIAIFIFDLHKNESKTLNLFETKIEIENNDIIIDSISILTNQLVIASHYLKTTPQSFAISQNPRINTLDIETEKSLHEYQPCENGLIKNLTVNSHYIVFLIDESRTGGDDLYYINLIDHAVDKIKQIPHRVDDSLNITLTNSLLTACFSSEAYTEERYVIDLDAKEILQETNYERFVFHHPSFSNGVFIVPTNHTRENAIYTENFHHLECPDEENKKNSIRLV